MSGTRKRLGLCVVRAEFAAPVVSSHEIHIDGLLVIAELARKGVTDRPSRSMPLDQLARVGIRSPRIHAIGSWLYLASAWRLPPEARVEPYTFTQRRETEEMARPRTPGSGPGRDRMVTRQSIATPWAEWLVVYPPREARKALVFIRSVGDERSHGMGTVKRWEVEEQVDGNPADALVLDGRAVRHLPPAWSPSSTARAFGALRPPYWHPAAQEEIVPVGALADLHPDVLAAIEAGMSRQRAPR